MREAPWIQSRAQADSDAALMTADYRLPDPPVDRLAHARSRAYALGLRLVWSNHYQHARTNGGRYRLLDGDVTTHASDYLTDIEKQLRRLARDRLDK